MPKLKLTEIHRTRSAPKPKPYLIWDTDQKADWPTGPPKRLSRVQGHLFFHNRVRWLHLADATAIGLQDARKLARKVMYTWRKVRTRKREEGQRGTAPLPSSRSLCQGVRPGAIIRVEARRLSGPQTLAPRWGKLLRLTLRATM